MSTTTKRPVRFGISLPNRAVLFGLPPQVLLETAEQAEASGLFDSVWVGDNFLSKPRLEAIVTLSALAARTKRLKLGTICLASFPLRHPLSLAIQWASLDVLSEFCARSRDEAHVDDKPRSTVSRCVNVKIVFCRAMAPKEHCKS